MAAEASLLSLRPQYPDMKSVLPLGKMQNVAAWAKQYQENQPFPHIGIDDFFDDSIIRNLVSDYPGEFDASWNRTFLDAGTYEEQKLGLDRLEAFPPSIQHFVNALNSRVFVEFLERLTGIDGLIPDPHLFGGGLHMIPRGGRLGVHADFNTHEKLRLDRRLNLLLYLNYDWKKEWGGALELWDRDVKVKVKEYLPIANRVVVFTTTDSAYHGHPDPLTSPKGRYRKSIAMYYYTNGRPEEERSERHTTIFRMRPNEIRRRKLLDNLKPFLPPIVWQIPRLFRKPKH
ncbi:2OG-Fe(II) oxygenase [Bradyrhizobium sp. C-145]|uniref:2OG-Fe(II) oxygenase n=1 Tax=Bradyrhizobium sp. C-145 TaxID=574727 RepID=UPI00201B5154|nr:2OG-Fe(II) oxygenase [Bradyrhizobium sp. C-145]UQR61028.1 2OG-Fe(II) oxygenase [Bradyrhizobium sp. C-145]